MIKAEYTMAMGEDNIKITVEAETHAEFVDKLSFFTTIPKKGPNGETDLRLVHRVAKGKFHYYSLISDIAKQEYKFGQSLDKPGTLFCKGPWEPIFSSDGADEQQQTETKVTSTTTTSANVDPAKTVKATVVATVTAKPTVTATVTKPLANLNVNLTKTAPVEKTNPAVNVIKAVTPLASATTTVAKTQPASTPTPPKSNAAASILAKMNIQKTN